MCSCGRKHPSSSLWFKMFEINMSHRSSIAITEINYIIYATLNCPGLGTVYECEHKAQAWEKYGALISSTHENVILNPYGLFLGEGEWATNTWQRTVIVSAIYIQAIPGQPWFWYSRVSCSLLRTLTLPSFTKGKKQLTGIEMEQTRRIANVWIHVIGLLRQKYSLLTDTVPIDYVLIPISTICTPKTGTKVHDCHQRQEPSLPHSCTVRSCPPTWPPRDLATRTARVYC